MTNNKIIIGLVGEMAAGKTTVTDYLREKHGAVSFRFSNVLRDILDRLHLEVNRPSMQQLSTLLRQNFGEDLLSKVLALDAKNATEPFVITEGIRRPSDVTHLKKFPSFHIIALRADERTRYERLAKRSENADDAGKTWEQFQIEGRAESEEKIREIASEAEHQVDNNGSKEELFEQIEKIIETIKEKAS